MEARYLDPLRADDLPGLTAGGKEHDWIACVTAGIDTGAGDAVAKAPRLQLNSVSYQPRKERLPTYWAELIS